MPAFAAYIAASCDESAATGTARSAGATLLSRSSGVIEMSPSSHSVLPEMRLATTLFSASSSARLRISFHMMKRLKEN